MVEASDFANRDDLAEFRPLNWAAVGRILVERAEEREESKQVPQESDHRARILSGSAPTDQRLAAGRGFGEGQGYRQHGPQRSGGSSGLFGRLTPAVTHSYPNWLAALRAR